VICINMASVLIRDPFATAISHSFMLKAIFRRFPYWKHVVRLLRAFHRV